MPADIASTLASWSTTEASNLPNGATTIGGGLDENLRMIQAVVRQMADTGTIASATTTNLATVNNRFVTVTGTTTITGLGTLSAGMSKWLIFSGALTLTHNVTSLILPGAENIATAAGDCGLFESLGSGNWRCLVFTKASGTAGGYSTQDFVTKDLIVYGKLQIGMQPSFSAWNSVTDTNQTGNGAEATVQFDSEIFDLAGNFAGNTFTAPVVGKYLLVARVMLSNIVSATSILLRIATSNRNYYKYYTPAAAFSFNYFSMDAVALADMDAGDTATVTITVSGMAGNTVSINGSGSDPHTVFAGELLA